ncbi:hypothetical protein GQ457_12G026860 [Hibiscus cannabinus]
MDKSWMDYSRVSNVYRSGVESFLNLAFATSSQENMILCPCKKCVNSNWHEKLREKRAEYEATASTHNSSVNANDIDNQVIAEVFGLERYGRVRGQGSFVTPTAYFGSSSSQYMPSQSRSINVEVDRIKQQLQQEMDAKIAEIQAQNAARDAEREATMAAREAEKEATFAAREAALQQKYENMESQLAKLLKMMQKDQSQDSPSDP